MTKRAAFTIWKSLANKLKLFHNLNVFSLAQILDCSLGCLKQFRYLKEGDESYGYKWKNNPQTGMLLQFTLRVISHFTSTVLSIDDFVKILSRRVEDIARPQVFSLHGLTDSVKMLQFNH